MGDQFLPPASLEAKTKGELRRLMVANNLRHGKEFIYFDFSFAQGKWHCWFRISQQDLEALKLKEKAANG